MVVSAHLEVEDAEKLIAVHAGIAPNINFYSRTTLYYIVLVLTAQHSIVQKFKL